MNGVTKESQFHFHTLKMPQAFNNNKKSLNKGKRWKNVFQSHEKLSESSSMFIRIRCLFERKNGNFFLMKACLTGNDPSGHKGRIILKNNETASKKHQIKLVGRTENEKTRPQASRVVWPSPNI
ncbi:CLUMA_CG021475, isoform A [Clunio marinus]|uniref:CLUMA_CG021475, isoform A n=1 Tax=Clunio marinus TaxID=568069 RepID=A0A1J1J7U4_9DIPT|nr:CLUMA_CG021475, isoform A [Clunio marinus]